jgi:hypothetical protein
MTGLGLDGSLTDFGVLTQDFGPMVAIDEWRFGMALSDVMVQPQLAGDYNQNGFVDAADYVLWRKNPSSFPADAYATWRAHFGQTTGSGSAVSANAAIPEPTTLVLLTFVAACSCLRRGPAA